MKRILIYTFFLFFITWAQGQSNFKMSLKSGPLLPYTTFYRGLQASANEFRDINAGVGFSSELHLRLERKNKDYLSVHFSYQAFPLEIKEFVRFPVDVLKIERSFYYSEFEVKNIGLGINLGKKLSKKLTYRIGLQYNFPLSDAKGYLYLAGLNQIEKYFDYKDKSQFQLNSGVDVTIVSSKNIDFSVGPQFAIFLNKDPETHALKNQLRKYYFALLFGINFK